MNTETAAQARIENLLAKVQSLEQELRAAKELLGAAARRDADRDRYTALFSATQEGLLIVDDDGRYADVNDAYARLLKSTPEALIGHHYSEFIPPDRLAEADEAFRTLKADGPGLNEFPLRAADGSVVDCEWTVRPHFLPGLSLCSARDISRRRSSEEALKLSEARFRFLTRLDDATRPVTNPEEIVQTTARLLGGQLGIDSVALCGFNADQQWFAIGDYSSGAAPGICASYNPDQFGSALSEALRGNRPYIVEDVESDPRTEGVREHYRQLRIGAHLAVPLHKGGRLVAALGVHQGSARRWKPDDVELVQLVANRCWESIDRLRAEANFRRQSRTFDVVLSNLPDLICTFDLAGCFTYANPALLGVWQKTLPEIIGLNTFDLGYPPELAERIQSEVKTVIVSGKPVRNHTPFTGGSGETRVYEYIFSPVLLGDSSLEAVTCTARDITDRVRMEREVAASQERLQQVLAQAPVAIIVFRGRDLVIELANPFYLELVQGRELVGRPLAQAIPELGKDVLDALYYVMDTGEPFTANDWLIRYDHDADGVIEDHWFNVVYHPLRDPEGTVSRVIAVCSEVTVQVLARKELERANRELEEFAYVASHDLQEPLRMVGIYTQMLISRCIPDNPVAHEYAGYVREGVERIEQLIHDLLAYSRIIHTEGAPWGIADLNESLAGALKTMESRIGETNARVSTTPLPMVRGETSQLAHVFQNLLSNSLKYREAGRATEIQIGAKREGANWIISVQDNGIGFELQYAQRIFGLFKRLYKEEFSGTGLGLAICQRIVERYGGRIWAEAVPGEGATFYISLISAEAL